MNIERKIERTKVEIDFITEGDGTQEEKQAAIDEIKAYADLKMAEVPVDGEIA